jgi:hypothetical protein
MNSLPIEVVNKCISFLDFDSTKYFGATCKYYHELAVNSQNYLAPFLSSCFTKVRPQDLKIIIDARTTMIFKTVNLYIEKPVAIYGRQLHALSELVNKNTISGIALKLIINDLRDIACASDSNNDTLLSRVCSVEYQDEQLTLDEYFQCYHQRYDDEKINRFKLEALPPQRDLFVKFLLQKVSVQKLILGNCDTNALCGTFYNSHLCPLSIRELEISPVLNRDFEERISHLLTVFFKVEKLIFRDLQTDHFYENCSARKEWSMSVASSVKELVFLNSRQTFSNVCRILRCIPGVEKIAILRPLNFLDFMYSIDYTSGFKHSYTINDVPVLSVREIRICEISYKCWGRCTYHVNSSFNGCQQDCEHDVSDMARYTHPNFNNADQICKKFLEYFPEANGKITITEKKEEEKKRKADSKCVIS